jgi:hypothetical protein
MTHCADQTTPDFLTDVARAIEDHLHQLGRAWQSETVRRLCELAAAIEVRDKQEAAAMKMIMEALNKTEPESLR